MQGNRDAVLSIDVRRDGMVLASSGADGCVKLWDLRSASCVRKFEAHVNRVTPVGASLSPCLRYVCCGSEDRSAYLYDARGGGLVGWRGPLEG